MPNPRSYPDTIQSAESGRPLHRGNKKLTIKIDGYEHTYDQPGWWANIDDPADTEGQIVDEDNMARNVARREAEHRAAIANLAKR